MDAASSSGLSEQSASADQLPSSPPVSLVDQFLESFTAKLSGTDRSYFEEIFIPILKDRLPTANASLQKSIISYFEKGGSFSQPILRHCPLSDWVKESLIQDLLCGHYEDGNEITYPHFLKQLDQIVSYYQGPFLEQLLLSIHDAAEKSSFGLMELSYLLEFLLLQTDYDAVSTLLPNRSNWISFLQSKYLNYQLAQYKISLSYEDQFFLDHSIGHRKWRPFMIRELVSIINQISDFSPVKDLLNFIQKYDFSGQEIEQALYAYPDDQGIICLNKCLGQLATRVVEDQISVLFPDHASSINGELPSFFTYASPIETLETLRSFLNSFPQVDRSAPSVSTFNSFLEGIDVDALLNEPISKHFLDAITLLSEYKVDVPTAISAFKLLEAKIQQPHTWEGPLHELVISASFKEAKPHTLSKLAQQISQQSPDISFVSDPNLLEQRCQEIINSYDVGSSILPGKAISQWSKEEVRRWSNLVKEKSDSFPKQKEILAVIQRAVVLHHGYAPRESQLLTLLTLLNPTEGLGRLAQVNTGEGKSLIIAMFSAVHALQGKKVDIITTSTELTIPEVAKQAGFFEMLNLTVGENSRKDFNSEKETIKAVYGKDIVYGTPIDFQGDILRTEFSAMDTREGRRFDIAIVDEVDSMLYDQRKHSTRLSSLMPGMDHLALTLGAIWHEVNRLSSQIVEKDGHNFLITEPCTQEASPSGPTITLSSEKSLVSCLKPIEDIESFIKPQVKARIAHALRVLTLEEAQEWKTYKALQQKDAQIDIQQKRIARKIAKRELKLSKGLKQWFFGKVETNRRKLAEYKKQAAELSQAAVSSSEALNNALFTKRAGILDIPDHLRTFALDQLPYWIDNAIKARYVLKEGFHYAVKNGQVVPIDYDNTGVLQHNVVWSDGMHQLLQIKEGLKITPENVATNFLTNASFFKRYSASLFGLTGTLGNVSTQSFLQNVYNVDMVVIPPYQLQQIASNETSPYRCKELPAIIVPTTEEWYKSICDTTVSKVQNGRPVLIICKYIKQVEHLKNVLAKRLGNCYKNRIFTYTGESETTHPITESASETDPIKANLTQLIGSFGKQQEKFTKRDIDLGEIIIATNIAGRGTDITPSDKVEAIGGMHVCITFLPESYRVEIQNAGRTARQGRKGSAQLVVHDPSHRSIDALRAARNEQEAIETTNAQKDLAEAFLQDRFFSCFCGLESELLPRASDAEKMNQYASIQSRWLIHKDKALNPHAIDRDFKRSLPKLLESAVEHYKNTFSEEEKLDPKFPEYIAAFKEDIKQDIIDHKDAIKQSYKANVLRDFCTKLQADKYPSDVIECFREGKPFKPEGSSLATQYGWGEYERNALQERWGIWFNRLQHDKKSIDLQDVVKTFDQFGNAIRSDGTKDKLVKNPYYYVQKGNEALDRLKNPQLAIEIYQKAIDLDETYNVTARYNKARALLTIEDNQGRNQEIAKAELEEAIRLINYEYKPALISFQHLLILLHKKAKNITVSDHVAHQLDILSIQSDHIDIAIEVLDKALRKGWHVKLRNQSLQEALKGTDGDHSQAIGEAYANGLTDIFTLRLKKPTPWYSIISVAIIGAAQATAGFLMSVYTAGSSLGVKLLIDGLSDLFSSVTSAIRGDFSWKNWSIQKGISWSVSFISSGWEGIKKMGTDIRDTFRGVKNSLTGVNQAVTATGATVGAGATDMVIRSSQPDIVSGGLQEAKQQFVQHFKESVTSKLLQVSVNHMVVDPVLHGIKSLIDKKLDRILSERLQNNPLITRGITLDLKNRDNHWQQLFINDGLELLEPSPNNTFINACTEMGKGVVINKIDQLNAREDEDNPTDASNQNRKLTGEDYMDIIGLPKMLYDLAFEAPKFLDQFESKIQQHTSHIAEAERKAKQEEETLKEYKLDQGIYSSSAYTSVPPSEIAFDEVRADQFRADHDYNLNPLSPDYGAAKRQVVGITKCYTCYFPSSYQHIKDAFKSAITNRLVESVSSNLFQPLTRGFSRWEAQEIWKESAKEVKEFSAKQLPKVQRHNLAENLILSSDEQADPVDSASCTPILQAYIESVKNGAPLGVGELGHIAKEINAPIQVHVEGKYYDVVGGNLPGRRVIINLIKTDKEFHWVNMRHSEVLPTSDSRGKNNCLFDAILPQLDRKKNISSADSFRNKYIESCLRNPKRTEEIVKNRSIIDSRDPDALYQGGSDHIIDSYLMQTDPHCFLNRSMLYSHDKEYKELNDQEKKAKPEYKKAIQEKLKQIEQDAFNKTKIQQANWNDSLFNFVVIGGVTYCTGGAGLSAYILSRAAVAATSMALDDELCNRIVDQDYAGAWDQAQHYFPLCGTARGATRAIQKRDYIDAGLNVATFAV
ncbi:DEAD/DEAH box helicase [Cardinium endosymbiont of Nabis limbatus]|uniref:preprotein translocase subunit SecA n=1 Tax=Cardinium endosymbiont of Nabis limbatus TaxID=3066217 RepID=UPI003AF34D7C